MPLVGDLNIQQQPIQLKTLPLFDFRGGLCLTRDGFLVPDNASPSMCNVDVMAEGGICTRDSIIYAHYDPLPAKVCQIWQRQYYDQEATIMVSLEDGTVWEIDCTTGAVGQIPGIQGQPGSECCWRGVQANNVMYVYNGVDAPYAIDPDGTIRVLSQAWNDWVEGQDPPVAGYELPCCDSMVIAKKMAFFQGALWAADVTYPPGTKPLSDFTKGQPLTNVETLEAAEGTKNPAGTNEETINRCNRIHFSFPIQGETGPEDWNSNDWLDLDEGADGECVTALVPCGNTMYVFKEHSVYAVTFDTDGIPTTTKYLDKVGTPSCDSVVCCEGNVYFWDTRSGLNVISRDGSYTNLFRKLSPLLDDCPDDPAAFSKVAVGWCEGRIFVSMPWRNEVYVLDTRIESMPWVKYDWCVDKFFNFCPSGEQGWCVGASTISNYLMKLAGHKETDGVHDFYAPWLVKSIESYYCTNWFGAASSAISSPYSKKDWCAINVIGFDTAPNLYGQRLQLEYYSDQDERIKTGQSDVVWDAVETPAPICLDEYVFPAGPTMMRSGDEVFPDPCFKYPEGTPCFLESDWDEREAKDKGTCIELPCDSCSLQICIRGYKIRWCICSLQIQFREGPDPKQAYERN